MAWPCPCRGVQLHGQHELRSWYNCQAGDNDVVLLSYVVDDEYLTLGVAAGTPYAQMTEGGNT
jgi:hypothetical protein